ncbi:MAG TPA: hypothetical protein DEF51_08075 [Myxococcales bacterium]|nr:hypothetical protein [Myxococcales bacterium]
MAGDVRVPLYKVRMPPSVEQPVLTTLRSGALAGGAHVAAFEGRLREYLGNPLVLSTADLPASITMSLYLAGVRPGDEVVCSPMVCLATSMPINTLFATTRWCDVDPETGNMDAAALERCITPKTKAVLVFHWGGTPAALTAIRRVAQSHGVPVVDDASEALGASVDGARLGNTGADFTTFSFYPNKPLNTGSDGGAIAFASPEAFERAQWMRRFGIHQPSFRTSDGEIDPASDVSDVGWSSALSNVNAAIGVEQLGTLDDVLERARENADFYDRAIAEVDGIAPCTPVAGADRAPWVHTVRVERRDDLMRKLKARGVQCSRVHLRNDLYSCFRAERVELPGVDAFSAACLSVPCGWWVSREDREYVSDVIASGW